MIANLHMILVANRLKSKAKWYWFLSGVLKLITKQVHEMALIAAGYTTLISIWLNMDRGNKSIWSRNYVKNAGPSQHC